MSPLFSVVIPLYNKADTIERTIRSVARQTYADYELVVVNDGSTDDSLAVVRKLSKNLPIRVIDRKNGGVSSARNAGAMQAQGKYIALLDGDDVWYPSHLARMAAAIRKFPNVGMFGGGYEWQRDGRIYFTWRKFRYRVLEICDAYRYGQPTHTSAIVIRKDIWMSAGGFDERYSYFEDHEFFFRLGEKTKCCLVPGISERYTTDAGFRATGSAVRQDPRTWPHILLINQRILSGTAAPSMVRYANVQAKLKASFAYLHRNYESIDFWNRSYVGVVGTFRLWKMFVERKNRIACLLYSHFFLCWYRINNHLILWVRKDSRTACHEA